MRKAPTVKPTNCRDELDEDILPSAIPMESFAPTLDELKDKFDSHRRHDLKFYFEVGQVVDKSYTALTAKLSDIQAPKYGFKLIKRLEEALGQRERLLYDCFAVVRTYKKAEIQELCNAPAITPTHLFQLAAISDNEKRQALQEKVIEENLTVKQLCHLIHDQQAKKTRAAGGGRQPKIHSNAKGGLVHVLAVSKQVLALHTKSWFCEKFNIAKAINDIPPDKLNQELLELTKDVVQTLQKIEDASHDAAHALDLAVEKMEQRMTAQAEYNRQHPVEDVMPKPNAMKSRATTAAPAAAGAGA